MSVPSPAPAAGAGPIAAQSVSVATVNLDPAANQNFVVTNPAVCGRLRFGPGTPQAYYTYTLPAAMSTGTLYIDTCSGGDPSVVRPWWPASYLLA